MPRSGDDAWDIVTSVGATALVVATLRAVETRKPDPLARDDYARYFVAATPAQATLNLRDGATGAGERSAACAWTRAASRSSARR